MIGYSGTSSVVWRDVDQRGRDFVRVESPVTFVILYFVDRVSLRIGTREGGGQIRPCMCPDPVRRLVEWKR